jgi:hypothetical protein
MACAVRERWNPCLEKADVFANYSARIVINVEVYFRLVTCKTDHVSLSLDASSVIAIG